MKGKLRLLDHFNNMKIGRKIMSAFVMASIVPILTIQFIGYNMNSNSLKRKIDTLMVDNLTQLSERVDLTLIDWLRQYTTQTLETDIRSWLGRMLFSGDEALKKANVLSGGERVRCMLCKMMLSGANVLVLDEPTNHLDLESITALNDGLIRYPETILFTSHDHQFVQTVADRIIEVSGNTLLDRKGTYDEFLADFDEDQLKKY